MLFVVILIIGLAIIMFNLLIPKFTVEIVGKVISCSKDDSYYNEPETFRGEYYTTVQYSVNGIEYEDCVNTYMSFNENDNIIVYLKKGRYDEIYHSEGDTKLFFGMGAIILLLGATGIFYNLVLKKELHL